MFWAPDDESYMLHAEYFQKKNPTLFEKLTFSPVLGRFCMRALWRGFDWKMPTLYSCVHSCTASRLRHPKTAVYTPRWNKKFQFIGFLSVNVSILLICVFVLPNLQFRAILLVVFKSFLRLLTKLYQNIYVSRVSLKLKCVWDFPN